MRIDIVSIFCEYLDALNLSLIGKAQDKGIVEIVTHDLRDFTHDIHRTVDDTPYGGGAGMVMRPEPWGEALDHVLAAGQSAVGSDKPVLVIPSPAGHKFSQRMAADLAQRSRLVFACGRYEGIDERVFEASREHFDVMPVSLGDYVLNGGEVAVLAMTEAVVRLVPGVVGNPESLVEESHSEPLLEYPVYTKPASWRGLDVPQVLLGGDHKAIADWRFQQQLARTAVRRPDLLPHYGDDVLTRSATPADAGQLFSLGLAVQAGGGSWPLGMPGSVAAWQSLIAAGGVFVVEETSRLVAVAVLAEQGESGGAAEVVGMMVIPDRQSHGVGRELLAALGRGRDGLKVLVPNSRKDIHKVAKRRKWRRKVVDGGIRYTVA